MRTTVPPSVLVFIVFAAAVVSLFLLNQRVAPTRPLATVEPRANRVLRRRFHERRRTHQATNRLATALSDAAQSIRAGHSIRQSWDEACRRHNCDFLFDTRRSPLIAGIHPDVALAAQTVQLAQQFGGPVALSMDSAASVLRERQAMSADRHSQAAQARLSARVLTLVPLVLAAYSLTFSPSTRNVVLHSPVALACAGAGLVVNALGWWWMRSIIERELWS